MQFSSLLALVLVAVSTQVMSLDFVYKRNLKPVTTITHYYDKDGVKKIHAQLKNENYTETVETQAVTDPSQPIEYTCTRRNCFGQQVHMCGALALETMTVLDKICREEQEKGTLLNAAQQPQKTEERE